MGASGSVREASGSARKRLEKSDFFRHFWKIFIFEVFGDSVNDFVKELDESSCPCDHVKSWKRAKIGSKEVGGSLGVSCWN